MSDSGLTEDSKEEVVKVRTSEGAAGSSPSARTTEARRARTTGEKDETRMVEREVVVGGKL